jgi:hypothetical protein
MARRATVKRWWPYSHANAQWLASKQKEFDSIRESITRRNCCGPKEESVMEERSQSGG